MKVTITGASDDLIEIDGDLSEEWQAPKSVDDKGSLICVSDGSLLRIRYDDDAIWRVDLIWHGKCEMSKVAGDKAQDTFDVVTLRGDIAWVAMGDKYVYKK